MKVKQLIKELLDMPMDAKVLIGVQVEDGNYNMKENPLVADYEDGYIGIFVPLRDEVK